MLLLYGITQNIQQLAIIFRHVAFHTGILEAVDSFLCLINHFLQLINNQLVFVGGMCFHGFAAPARADEAF